MGSTVTYCEQYHPKKCSIAIAMKRWTENCDMGWCFYLVQWVVLWCIPATSSPTSWAIIITGEMNWIVTLGLMFLFSTINLYYLQRIVSSIISNKDSIITIDEMNWIVTSDRIDVFVCFVVCFSVLFCFVCMDSTKCSTATRSSQTNAASLLMKWIELWPQVWCFWVL